MMFYVYILKSRNFDEIYVGSTGDLRRRLKEHNCGLEISTKKYAPWNILYYEAYEREDMARMREHNLKCHGNALRELKKRIGFPAPTKSVGVYPAPLFDVKSGAGFPPLESPSAGNGNKKCAKERDVSSSLTGFTLVELIVAMSVFLVATTFAVGTFIQGLRSQRELTSAIAVNNSMGTVLEQMAREIRTGYSFFPVSSDGEDYITFQGDEGAVEYRLSPTSGVLTRTSRVGGSEATRALTGSDVFISSLRFFVLHPEKCAPWRVTISLGVQPTKEAPSSRLTHIQTTVSSRILQADLEIDADKDGFNDYRECRANI